MSSPRWHTASADAVLYVQCILNICTTHPHHGGPVFKIHLHSIHSRSNKKELRISGWLSPPWDNRAVTLLCPSDIGHYPSCDELRAFSGAYSKRSFKIDLLSIITPRNWKLYFETTTWSTYWQDGFSCSRGSFCPPEPVLVFVLICPNAKHWGQPLSARF